MPNPYLSRSDAILTHIGEGGIDESYLLPYLWEPQTISTLPSHRSRSASSAFVVTGLRDPSAVNVAFSARAVG